MHIIKALGLLSDIGGEHVGWNLGVLVGGVLDIGYQPNQAR